MTPANEIVLRLLTSIGRPAEAELYLSLFRSQSPESFAVLCVDRHLSGALADALVVDLELLAELGLTPILTFPSARDALRVAEQLSEKVRSEVVGHIAAAQVARQGGMPLVPISGPELSELVREVGTRKVVLLGSHGTLSRSGEPISIIDVAAEDQELRESGALSAHHLSLYIRAQQLVEDCQVSVAITSPLELLRELFTVRGAGTLVRKGTPVVRHRSVTMDQRSEVAAIIEAAFGRGLSPEFWERPVDSLYLAGGDRGAALVRQTEHGPYLTKLAVGTQARGEGIGRDLWRALVADYPILFWRARNTNPITQWYRDQCTGMIKQDPWIIYWRGLAPEVITPAIAWAAAAPVDL